MLKYRGNEGGVSIGNREKWVKISRIMAKAIGAAAAIKA